MVEYLDLNKRDIDALPREKTIFVSAVSAIEVHGPHLPVGSDFYVAKEVMLRFVQRLNDFNVVHLPDLALGGQPQPVLGSIPTKWRTLRDLLETWGEKLKQMGFQYWIVFDNHGGFTHQLAFMEASEKLLKKDFYLIVPFLSIYQEMLQNKKEIGLPPGKNGNLDDLHAGTNETSLMLVVRPDLVSKDYRSLERYLPKTKSFTGNLVRKLLGREDIALVLDWIGDPNNPYYIGAPAEANKKNGEIMMEYHIKRSLELFEEALDKTYKPPKLFKGMVKFLLKIYPEW